MQLSNMSILGYHLVSVLFILMLISAGRSAASNRDGINAGDILAPGQKWRNYDTGAVLVIDKVNKFNSTIAGTYNLNDGGPSSQFPFRGEFDPEGSTVGLVVSYWNKYTNDHALGAWAGYVIVEPNSRQYVLSTSGLIAHESDHNTSSGYATFVLESN